MRLSCRSVKGSKQEADAKLMILIAAIPWLKAEGSQYIWTKLCSSASATEIPVLTAVQLEAMPLKRCLLFWFLILKQWKEVLKISEIKDKQALQGFFLLCEWTARQNAGICCCRTNLQIRYASKYTSKMLWLQPMHGAELLGPHYHNTCHSLTHRYLGCPLIVRWG